MSYSFGVRAASKAEAKAEVAKQLALVVKNQPVHKADLPAAQATADAFIDLLADDASKSVAVSVNGFVSWVGVEQKDLTSAGVSINAYLTT